MNHFSEAKATSSDPVCGMRVDPTTAVGSSILNGRTYDFCSRRCEATFDAAPEKYSGATVASPANTSCCSKTRTRG